MMLGPGSIEWGSKRSALERFDYAACDLALCDRHEGEWVGLMNIPACGFAALDGLLESYTCKCGAEIRQYSNRVTGTCTCGHAKPITQATIAQMPIPEVIFR